MRACAHTRPRHRWGVGERPHVRGSVERTASLVVTKARCRGGRTRWPWRAEWPLQGIPSEKAAIGGCGPISTNHVALFGLSCTRFYPAPCFGHIPITYTLFRPPPFFFQLFFCIMYVTQTRQQTAHEQCRVRATTSWLQRYTRLPPASIAGSYTTHVP